MQSLITVGWILIVNTVATAYNPKAHSRQRRSDSDPLPLLLLTLFVPAMQIPTE